MKILGMKLVLRVKCKLKWLKSNPSEQNSKDILIIMIIIIPIAIMMIMMTKTMMMMITIVINSFARQCFGKSTRRSYSQG